MSHPLKLRMYLILYFTILGVFYFVLLGLFFCFIFILLDLFVLYHPLPQAQLKWRIGRAMERSSIFYNFLKKKVECITCFFDKKINFQYLKSYIPLNTITIECCPKIFIEFLTLVTLDLLELGEYVDVFIRDSI